MRGGLSKLAEQEVILGQTRLHPGDSLGWFSASDAVCDSAFQIGAGGGIVAANSLKTRAAAVRVQIVLDSGHLSVGLRGRVVLPGLELSITEHAIGIRVARVERDRVARLARGAGEVVQRVQHVCQVTPGGAQLGLELQGMQQGLRCEVVVGDVAGFAALLDIGVAQLVVHRRIVRPHPQYLLADDDRAIDGALAKSRRRQP